MKKLKLFFAAFALLLGISNVSAYQTPTAGEIYYLYNTACTDGTPGFMSTGNGYGFQVVIDSFGFPVKLIDAGDGNFQFQFIHHEGYLSDDGFMYSDGGTDRARTIQIQDQGSGNYKLLNTNNSKEIEDWYGNVVGDGAGNRHNYIWQFLSKAERDAIIAGYATSVKMSAASSMGMPASVDNDEKFDAYLAENYIGVDQSTKITNGTFTTAHVTTDWSTTANSNRSFNIGWGNQDPKDTPEVYEGAGYLTHTTISVDKAGLYKVSVNATYRCGNNANNNRIGDLGYDGSVAYLQANNNIAKLGDWYSGKINGNGPGSPSEANSKYFSAGKYLTEVYVYVDDAKTIDISLHSHAFTWGGWLMFNNFKLTYYSDEVSDEDATALLAAAAAVNGKPMLGTVQATLTSAVSSFDGARTIANYNALSEAVSEAETSVTAYANAKAYLDEAAIILEGTNVYTAAAYATYYSEPKAKYDAQTLTTSEANALVKTSTGWHSANTIDDILLSTWTIGGEQCKDYDKALYINTWSTEGNNDGSEFLTPFFEYWTNDDKSLDAKDLVATVSGLKANETYTFLIRARVRQTNDKTKIANGITMKVGSGEAVDISAGSIFKTGPFYIGNFSAVGQTDADGKLTATISVAENSNISWLSFYNAKYVEGEDLSAYIADYEFALSTATESKNAPENAAVTGKEKVDLEAAIGAYSEVDLKSKSALIEAKNALEAATTPFVNAVPTYTTFSELNKTVATKLGVDLPEITASTVAADLDVETYIVNEYTAAKAYSEDYTKKFGDSWTNAPGTNKGESWDGTTGDKADTYYDLYNAADRTMIQTVSLPAGDYALIAKGRASVNGLLTLIVGGETVTFPHKGAEGRGIATNGDATFDEGATYAKDGKGYGWEYRVMTFTSTGNPIYIKFNWKTASNNWCGLDDIELRANPAVLDYSALQTAYDAVVIPTTLGFEAGEYAPYVNSKNLSNVDAAKKMLEKKEAISQSEIDALAAAITDMKWTANESEVNAFFDGSFSECIADDKSPLDYTPAGWTPSDNMRTMLKNFGEAMFDFENNNMNLPVGDGQHQHDGDLAGVTKTIGDVTISFTAGNNPGSRYFFNDSKGYHFNPSKNSTFKISVPEGKTIKQVSIVFQNSSKGLDVVDNKGTYDAGTWTGSEREVTFSAPGARYIYSINVNTEKDVHYAGLADASAETAMMVWTNGITYGEQAGYEMPLKANTVYKLSMKAAGWSNQTRSGISVSVLNESNKGLELYNLGTPDRDIVGNDKNIAGMTPLEIVFVTGDAGNYVFHVQSGNNMVLSDFELKKAASSILTISENGLPSYAPGTYPSVKLAREIKAGFNTLVVPFSMTQAEVEEQFGEGSVVYELKEFEGNVIHFQPADGVTANKPCILKAAKGGSEYSFAGREVEKAAPVAATAGAVTFNGSYAASFTVPNNGENYIVSGGKLYLVDSDNVTIAGTRAYFNVVGNQARSISFDGVLTGITTVENGEVKKAFTGDIFDLSGRKVKNPSKGIYVVEGKKVVF